MKPRMFSAAPVVALLFLTLACSGGGAWDGGQKPTPATTTAPVPAAAPTTPTLVPASDEPTAPPPTPDQSASRTTEPDDSAVVHVPKQHVVTPGDTLTSIAEGYSLSAVELLFANERAVRRAYEHHDRELKERLDAALGKLDDAERSWAETLLHRDMWSRRDRLRMAQYSAKAGYDLEQLLPEQASLSNLSLQLPDGEDASEEVTKALEVISADTLVLVVDDDQSCEECAQTARMYAQAARRAGKSVSAVVYFSGEEFTTYDTSEAAWHVTHRVADEDDYEREGTMGAIWEAADRKPGGIVFVGRTAGNDSVAAGATWRRTCRRLWCTTSRVRTANPASSPSWPTSPAARSSRERTNSPAASQPREPPRRFAIHTRPGAILALFLLRESAPCTSGGLVVWSAVPPKF
ncbi:MAG: hypothetical protein U0514_02390 [Candidatus Andersenbacteria bacterium]